jgi:hypothetical protein
MDSKISEDEGVVGFWACKIVKVSSANMVESIVFRMFRCFAKKSNIAK